MISLKNILGAGAITLLTLLPTTLQAQEYTPTP